MKIKTKKNILISLFFLFFTNLFAKIPLTVTPEIGLLNGHFYEYVFANECKNTDNVLSMLDWKLENVPYFGFDLETTLFTYLYANANIKFITNIQTGYMKDYDWLNSTPPSGPEENPHKYDSWINDDPTELTNFSEHTNTLDSLICFNLIIGPTFNINNFTINPFISWDYQKYELTASDGYLLYKSSDFNKLKFSGKGISYQLESNALMLGLNLKANLLDKFFIASQIMICPNINKLTTLDYHYVNRNNGGTLFLDEFANFFELKSKINISYRINNNSLVGLGFNIDYVPLTKGESYLTPIMSDGTRLTTTFNKSASEGGSQKTLWSLSVNSTIKW